MLGWSIAFLILGLISAIFGFGELAAGLVGIAQILFVIFLILFCVTFLMHLFSGRKTARDVV